jgi:hypothetical protein
MSIHSVSTLFTSNHLTYIHIKHHCIVANHTNKDLCEACIEGKGREQYVSQVSSSSTTTSQQASSASSSASTGTASTGTARERAKEAASRLYASMVSAAEQRRERNLKLREEKLEKKRLIIEERARARQLNKNNKNKLLSNNNETSPKHLSNTAAATTPSKQLPNDKGGRSPYLPAKKLQEQQLSPFDAFEDPSNGSVTSYRTRSSSNSSDSSRASSHHHTPQQHHKESQHRSSGHGKETSMPLDGSERKVDKDWLVDEAWSLNKGSRSAKQSCLSQVKWARETSAYQDKGYMSNRPNIMRRVFPAIGYERLSMKIGDVKVSSYPKLPKVGIMAGLRQVLCKC